MTGRRAMPSPEAALAGMADAARSLGRQAQGADLDMVGRYVLATGGTLLAAGGLKQGGLTGVVMAIAGCGLIWRASEERPLLEMPFGGRGDHARGVDERHGPVTYERSVTIGKPREEVYRFFRDFRNLPRFMAEVERIDVKDERNSHWAVKAPMGRRVEWDSEVHDEAEGERIAWRTVGNAEVHSEGRVRFKDAVGGRGTVVTVTLRYEPPGGHVGQAIAWLTGHEPQRQLADSLRRLKAVLETGDVVKGQGPGAGRDAEGN
jgi:uncharacterized membrane protein